MARPVQPRAAAGYDEVVMAVPLKCFEQFLVALAYLQDNIPSELVTITGDYNRSRKCGAHALRNTT